MIICLQLTTKISEEIKQYTFNFSRSGENKRSPREEIMDINIDLSKETKGMSLNQVWMLLKEWTQGRALRNSSNPFTININIDEQSNTNSAKQMRSKRLTIIDHFNILKRKLLNKDSVQQIAREFRISTSTVYRLLNWYEHNRIGWFTKRN